MISQRTRAALAAAKARVTKLGAPVLHWEKLSKAPSERATADASRVASVIILFRRQAGVGT